MRIALLTATWTLLCVQTILPAEELRVLEPQARVTMLRDYLRPLVHRALDHRKQTYEALKTPQQVAEYQQRLRATFLDSLGSLPKKTPLNARIVGRLTGDGYHIEKVIYESRPDFAITATLYLPNSPPPYPAVLLPCGHSENGKAAGAYQRAGMLLAKNGMAVLCYDPIGQGERKQLLEVDANGRQLPRGRFSSTSEHMLAGVAPILLGQSLATYRIWDGIRSIDYLISRDEIDGARIGCTGNSGGGLMTSYLMALDPRIVAAAPGCFITTTRRKNDSPGPGDAEQNIYAQTRNGLDHADYLILHAPQPALICAATRDFVPIAGAWESFREAQRIYARLGFPQRVDLIEADEKHGFTQPLRNAVAHWMQRWLMNRDETIHEDDSSVSVHTDNQLQCTPEGQVLLHDGARSVFDVYRATARQLEEQRRERAADATSEEWLRSVREIAGIRQLSELPPLDVTNVGTVLRDGYRIEKLKMVPEPGVVLPALWFVADQPDGKPILYLDGRGKEKAIGEGSEIERLVRQGRSVLAVDLRGYGETAMTPWRYGAMADYLGNNTAEFFVAYMLGRSLVGMRGEDTLVCARWLTAQTDANSAVELIAVGTAGVPALHAAALEPDAFDSLRLVRPLDRWQRALDDPLSRDQLENVIHGALRTYDLPDLRDAIGEARLTITTDVAGNGPSDDPS